MAGDGYSSPRFMYLVSSSIDGDASSGVAQLSYFMDPDFIGIADYLVGTLTPTVSDIRVQYVVDDTVWAGNSIVQVQLERNQVGNTSSGGVFKPPFFPLKDTGFVRAVTDNPGAGVTFSFIAGIYVFRRDVLERVPHTYMQQTLTRR